MYTALPLSLSLSFFTINICILYVLQLILKAYSIFSNKHINVYIYIYIYIYIYTQPLHKSRMQIKI